MVQLVLQSSLWEPSWNRKQLKSHFCLAPFPALSELSPLPAPWKNLVNPWTQIPNSASKQPDLKQELPHRKKKCIFIGMNAIKAKYPLGFMVVAFSAWPGVVGGGRWVGMNTEPSASPVQAARPRLRGNRRSTALWGNDMKYTLEMAPCLNFLRNAFSFKIVHPCWH